MKRTLILALLLIPAALFASDADRTGTFPAGERYEPPADHAPAATSRMYVRALTRDKAALELPASGDSSMLVWTIPSNGAKPLGARLKTPTGAVLRPTESGSIERGLRRFRFDGAEVGIDVPRGLHEVLHVMRSVAANYHLDVEMPGDLEGALVVVAEPESAITLESWVAPLSRQPGQPVSLYASLRDGQSPVRGARVTARLAPGSGIAGDSIVLSDAGDGVYTATVNELPSTPGVWQARFEATGETAEGVRFARTGSGEFIAERGAARLRAESVRAVRIDDFLRVTASVDVSVAGMYRFDVIVAGAPGDGGSRPALAWGEGMRRLSLGANTLSLDIPVDAAGELRLDVRLLGMDEMGVAGRAEIDVR